jgi:hypothetical protein
MEEMEKRSRRRTRDLVTQAASQGLSQNEIGCARISMMARSTNAPCKGRIQMRKTNPLHLFTFGLQRTAGPYSWVKNGSVLARAACPFDPQEQTSSGYTLSPVRAVRDIFAPQNTAPYSIVRSRAVPRPLSASNRRGIVRFGDQHYLGDHRSWT